MSRLAPLFSLALLAACSSTPEPREVREVSLSITSPAYGEYLGDGPIEVIGTVSDAAATVLVEDVEVPVAGDGTFRTTVDFAGDYEVIDVKAGGDSLVSVRERVPVFAGKAPIETFVHAMPGRMTNAGLTRLGASLGAEIDATDWADGLLEAIPPLDTSAVKLTPTEVTHDPTQVVITGVEGGLRIGVELRNVDIHTLAEWDVGPIDGSGDLVIGYDTITITLLATPYVRPDGVVALTVDDSFIDFADADFTLDGRALVGLSFLADAAGSLVEPAGQWLVDQVLGVAGEIELGGPFDFEQDVGGTLLAIQLRTVSGDPEGLPFLLGVGIDEPVPETLAPVETPSASTRADGEVHLVMGVHEYLLEGLIGDQIDSVLGGDLDVGPFSSVLGVLLGDMPGGNFAPEGEWCVALDVGDARTVRLKDGIAPMGSLYLPDVTVDFGVDQGSGCESWLVSNVALEVNLVPSGTEIGVEIGFGEGAILYYGAPREAWTEQELLVEVEGLVGTLADVAGGQLSIDLAELTAGAGDQEGLAGALGDVEPRILDSQPMAAEGMFALSLQVWPTEE